MTAQNVSSSQWGKGLFLVIYNRLTYSTLLAALVFFTGLLWAIAIPYNEAPDESNHFAVAQFIAEKERLPVFDEEDEILKTFCLDEGTRCYWSYAWSNLFIYILYAIVLKIFNHYFVARIFSALAMGGFVVVFSKIARKLFEERVAKLVTLFTVFIPQIVFLGSYVNSDSISLFISSIFVYFSLKIYEKGLLWRDVILFAVAAGLALLCKYNYYVTLIFGTFLVLAKAFSEVRNKRGLKREMLMKLAVGFVIVFLVAGWNFVRNFKLYGDPFALSALQESLTQSGRDPALYAQQVLTTKNIIRWPIQTYISFWGSIGAKMNILLDPVYYVGITAFVLLSLYGVWKNRKMLAEGKQRFLLFASIFAIFLNIVMSVWTSLVNDYQPQGKYLFPSIVPMTFILFTGVKEIFDFCESKMIKVAKYLTMINFLMSAAIFNYILIPLYYLGSKSPFVINEVFISDVPERYLVTGSFVETPGAFLLSLGHSLVIGQEGILTPALVWGIFAFWIMLLLLAFVRTCSLLTERSTVSIDTGD